MNFNTTHKYLFYSLCGLVLGIYILLGTWWSHHQRPTGDEPHYLIMAQSLIDDKDFELKNNYDNRDYSLWGYPVETLDRHISPNSQSNHQYPLHNFGWPIMLALGLWLGGHTGALLITEILSMLLIGNIFLFSSKITQKIWPSLVVTLTSALSVPIVIYAFQSFSEIAAAVLIIYGLRILIEEKALKYQVILAILAMAFLPWIHIKYLLVSLVFLILWFLKLKDHFRRYFLFIPLISYLLMSLTFKFLYQSFLPTSQYPSQMSFDFSKFFQGAGGLLIDKALGLFVFAPVYSFLLAGLILFFKDYRHYFWPLAGITLSVLLVQISGAQYLGWSPPGRFLVTILPLLVPALALFYLKAKTFGRTLFWLLSIYGFVTSYFLIRHPDLNYSLSEAKYLQNISPSILKLESFFPKLLNIENYPNLTQTDFWLSFFWFLGIILVTIIVLIEIRISRKSL